MLFSCLRIIFDDRQIIFLIFFTMNKHCCWGDVRGDLQGWLAAWQQQRPDHRAVWIMITDKRQWIADCSYRIAQKEGLLKVETQFLFCSCYVGHLRFLVTEKSIKNHVATIGGKWRDPIFKIHWLDRDKSRQGSGFRLKQWLVPD